MSTPRFTSEFKEEAIRQFTQRAHELQINLKPRAT